MNYRRRELIWEFIKERGESTLLDIAQHFGISKTTIHKSLKLMATSVEVARVDGGTHYLRATSTPPKMRYGQITRAQLKERVLERLSRPGSMREIAREFELLPRRIDQLVRELRDEGRVRCIGGDQAKGFLFLDVNVAWDSPQKKQIVPPMEMKKVKRQAVPEPLLYPRQDGYGAGSILLEQLWRVS